MFSQLAKIEVIKTAEGFMVYGRMATVIRANDKKEVVYSNLVETAPEYIKMNEALMGFKG